MVAAPRVRQRAAVPRDVRRGRGPPRRPARPDGPGEVPVHRQGGAARELPVRHVRCPPRADLPPARLVGHDGAPHGRRLHPAGHPHLVRADGAVHPRLRRPPRRPGPRRLRVRPVHRRTGRSLRRGGAGLHGHPGVRRHDRAPGDAHQRPQAGRHHGHTQLHAGHRGRDAPAGHRPAGHVAGRRHLRRRALDAGSAARDRGAARHPRAGHLRPVRGDGTRRGDRVRRDQATGCTSGRTTSTRRSSTRRPARCCRTANRASWSSPR